MRLRHKPKAVAALPEYSFYIQEPQTLKGIWQGRFSAQRPLSLELGCGFGRFSADYSALYPKQNILAVDRSRDVLVGACRLIDGTLGQEVGNLLICDLDAYNIENCLDISDGVENIFIFFCNPWPKRSHHRRRLTYPALLERYKRIIKSGGHLYFKTDDEGLYRASLRYFEECGLETLFYSENLSDNHPYEPLKIKTEYEQKFRSLGQNIYAAVVRF